MKNSVKAIALMAMIGCATYAAEDKKATPSVCTQKTVYIDMAKVFGEYHVTLQKNTAFKAKKAKADEFAAAEAQKLQARKQRIETFTRAYQSETDTNKKEAFEKAAKEEAFLAVREESELKDYIKKESEKLTKEFTDLRNSLVSDLQKQIDQFAAKNGISAIIDISGKTSNNLPVYIFYDKTKDITTQFLTTINAGYEKEVEAALKEQKAPTEATDLDINKLAEEAEKSIRDKK